MTTPDAVPEDQRERTKPRGKDADLPILVAGGELIKGRRLTTLQKWRAAVFVKHERRSVEGPRRGRLPAGPISPPK